MRFGLKSPHRQLEAMNTRSPITDSWKNDPKREFKHKSNFKRKHHRTVAGQPIFSDPLVRGVSKMGANQSQCRSIANVIVQRIESSETESEIATNAKLPLFEYFLYLSDDMVIEILSFLSYGPFEEGIESKY